MSYLLGDAFMLLTGVTEQRSQVFFAKTFRTSEL